MSLAIPAAADAVTAEWITNALRAGGLGVGPVRSVNVESVGAGMGLVSELSRVTLNHEAGGDGPTTLIVKMPSLMDNTRFVADLLGMYAREVCFYRQLAARTRMTKPGCFYADLDDDGKHFVLLLEDLSAGRVVDQLTGCSLVDGELVVDRLADLHAGWWNDPALIECGWLGRLCDSPFPEAVAFSFQQAWPVVRDRFAEVLPAPIVELGDRFDRTLPILIDWLSEPPYTLSHGDFRLDNMFFFDDPRDVVLCDWQLIDRSRGARDLAYFITQSFTSADRAAVEQTLVERYIDRLRSAGVDDYEADRAWLDYRIAALFAFVYPVIAAGALDEANERASRLTAETLSRSATAIMQLDCVDLLAPGGPR